MICVGIVAYSVLILLFLVGFLLSWVKKNNRRCVDLPFVSIIVAVRNERENLPKLLESLCSLEYPDYEIIVVDDSSEDGSFEVLSNYNCLKLKVIKLNKWQGKKRALQAGAVIAKGELLAFTDGDCIVDRNWLKSLVCRYLIDNCVLVGGIVNMYGRGVFAKLQALEFSSLIFSSIGAIGLGIPLMINGASLLVEKQIFLNAELRNEYVSGDDIFLLEYVRRIGGRVCVDTESVVFTKIVNSFREFIEQRLRWASKSKGQSFWAKFVAFLVFWANLSVILGFLFDNECIWIKFGIDFLALFVYNLRFRQLSLMLYYPLLAFIYPFYVVFIGILSQIVGFEWKGKKFGRYGISIDKNRGRRYNYK